jgi:hypothetical protein
MRETVRWALFAPCLLIASPAFAQVVAPIVPTTVITGQPIVDALLQWLTALTTLLIPIIGSILAAKIYQKWGVQVDAGYRDALQTAATNEAAILIQRLGPAAANMTRLDVTNPNVQKAVQGVIDRVPDAVSHFPQLKGMLGPAAIAKLIEAKLGLLTGVTDANGAPVGAAKPSIPVTAPPGAGR